MTQFLKLALIVACFRECMTDERIVGGVNAALGQIPYIVSLRDSNGEHFCGGSIIDDRWILTAAHCVKESVPSYVVAGTTSLSAGSGTQYKVIKSISHQKYDPLTVANDIALLKTEISIVFNTNVRSIQLGFDRIDANVPVLVSGWGWTSDPSSVPTTLQVLQTKTISNEACQTAIPKEIYDHVMCERTVADQGICRGDSGGPHVSNDRLYGISSWIVTPCGSGYPDVSTRVSSFIPWIVWTKITNFF